MPPAATGPCVVADTVIVLVQAPSYAPDEHTIAAFGLKSGDLRWYHEFDPGFHNGPTSPPVLVDGELRRDSSLTVARCAGSRSSSRWVGHNASCWTSP